MTLKCAMKRLTITLLLFVAFYVSGRLGIYLEQWQDSIIGGTAMFGASFVGLSGGIIKMCSDLFA